MPVNTRTHPDGTWVDGYVPLQSDWTDLDRKIFSSWNGAQGGAYCAPLTGSGAYSFDTGGLQVTGPTRLTRGGVISGPASAFVFAAGTWPQIGPTHVARAKKIVQPITTYATKHQHLWTRNHPYGGIGSVALACRLTYTRVVETSPLYIPLRVVDGATLTSCTLHFRVISPRIVAPIAMPRMRIMRVPLASGSNSGSNLPQPLRAADDGFAFLPLVTSADTWFNDGKPQTFTYVCDQNHVIDTANFTYVVHLIEEVGAESPDDEFDGIRFTERKADVGYAQVNSTQDLVDPESSQNATEGDVAYSGLRMLLVDSDDNLAAGTADSNYAWSNGIWVMDNNWFRAEDCDTSDDFTPNWIVRVMGGKKNIGCTWQCQYPSTGQRLNFKSSSVETLTQVRLDRAKPHGNIYHSLVPAFEVTDLRFQ